MKFKRTQLSVLFFWSTLTLISQTISFDDIKAINSKESFDRFVIENNFESRKSHLFSSENQDGVKIDVGYGHNLVQGNETIKASYQDFRVNGGNFQLQFLFFRGYDTYNPVTGELMPAKERGDYDATNDYKFILNQVKNQCSFYKIGKVETTYESGFSEITSYSCYTCPSSKYPGKICFVKGEIRINDPNIY